MLTVEGKEMWEQESVSESLQSVQHEAATANAQSLVHATMIEPSVAVRQALLASIVTVAVTVMMTHIIPPLFKQ